MTTAGKSNPGWFDDWPRRLFLAVAMLTGGLGGVLLLDRLFPPPLTRLADLSVTVVDRSGAPLKVFAVIYMPLPGAKP